MSIVISLMSKKCERPSVQTQKRWQGEWHSGETCVRVWVRPSTYSWLVISLRIIKLVSGRGLKFDLWLERKGDFGNRGTPGKSEGTVQREDQKSQITLRWNSLKLQRAHMTCRCSNWFTYLSLHSHTSLFCWLCLLESHLWISLTYCCASLAYIF